MQRFLTQCIALALLATLAGCASTPPETPYDPASMARIRVYKTVPVRLIFGDVCHGQAHQVVDTSSPGLAILLPNRTLGIPKYDGMPISRYDEYVMPANEIVTLRYYWQGQHANGTWRSYGPTYIQFRPVAGGDYETWVPYDRRGFLGPELRRVTTAQNGSVNFTMPPLIGLPFHRCGTRS